MAAHSELPPINWSTEVFTTTYLAKQIHFPLLVSITQSQRSIPNNESRSTLSIGDVLKVHGLKSFKKVLLTGATNLTKEELVANEYGCLSPPGSVSIHRQLSVPLEYSTPLQILPLKGDSHVYPTVGDIVNETPRPRSVVVNKQIVLPEKHCVINAGDVIAIISVDKRCTSSGVVDFLICKHNDKTIGLPMSCVGNFTPHRDDTLYTLSNLIGQHIDLPQKVRFVKPSPDHIKTLVRDGDYHIVPDESYIINQVVKQQYLVCTPCVREASTLSSNSLLFIPVTGPTAEALRFRLPIFHDLDEFWRAVNTRCCENLTVKDLLDCTAIELSDHPKIVIRRLAEVYDVAAPDLPPRRELCITSDSDENCEARYSPNSDNSGGKAIGYAGRRLQELDSPGGFRKSPSVGQMVGAEDQQPLLANSMTRRSAGHADRRDAHSGQRRGTSTPCTPESSRRKPAGSSHTWTEKISISLENIKKAFRKGGDDEGRSKCAIGDGSQLADSFENLSMNGHSNGKSKGGNADDCLAADDYENVISVAHCLQRDKTKGNSKPSLRDLTSTVPASQIRELWTPPSTPDYKDFTTAHLSIPPFSTVATDGSGSDVSAPNQAPPPYRPTPSNGAQQKAYRQPPPYHAHHEIARQNIPQQIGPPPRQASHQMRQPATTHDPCEHDSDSNEYINYKVMTEIPPPALRQASQQLQACQKNPVASPRQYSSKSNNNNCPPTLGTTSSPYQNSPVNHVARPHSGISYPCSHSSNWTVKEAGVHDIPADLTTLTVEELSRCMRLLELPRVAAKFSQHRIDGQFFKIMKDYMFKDDNFAFTDFEILKLKKLRDGWRPRL